MAASEHVAIPLDPEAKAQARARALLTAQVTTIHPGRLQWLEEEWGDSTGEAMGVWSNLIKLTPRGRGNNEKPLEFAASGQHSQLITLASLHRLAERIEAGEDGAVFLANRKLGDVAANFLARVVNSELGLKPEERLSVVWPALPALAVKSALFVDWAAERSFVTEDSIMRFAQRVRSHGITRAAQFKPLLDWMREVHPEDVRDVRTESGNSQGVEALRFARLFNGVRREEYVLPDGEVPRLVRQAIQGYMEVVFEPKSGTPEPDCV